jgi:hypothetical protein
LIGQKLKTVTINRRDSCTSNSNNNNMTVDNKKPVKQYNSNSPEWLVQRIKEDKTEQAISLLRIWMPESRRPEATEETVQQIRQLKNEIAIDAVNNLRQRKKFIRGSSGRDFKIGMQLERIDNGALISTQGLIDSGATGTCVNREFTEKHNIPVKELPIKMPVYNTDGTLNKDGAIEGFIEIKMTIGDHSEKIELGVTNLGKTDVFLGLDWLRLHNPNIDWERSTLMFDRCPTKCGYLPFLLSPEEYEPRKKLEEGERVFYFDWDGYVSKQGHIRMRSTTTSCYAHEYPDVFSKDEFDQLPERRPWDHVIELTPGSNPVDCKIYPLNLQEQKALDEFLEENL